MRRGIGSPIVQSILLWIGVASAGIGPLSAQLAPPNRAGISMAAVHFTVPDPAHHRALWSELFGSETLSRGPVTMTRLPGVNFVFSEGVPIGGSANTYIDHVGFLVPELEVVRNRVSDRGFPIVFENDANRQIIVEFPDGIRIEFTEERDLSVPLSLHHIHFFVEQGELLRAWYALVLGAEPSMRGSFFAARFPAADSHPGPELDFLSTDGASERVSNRGYAIDRIGFEVSDLEGFLRRLDQEGVTVEQEIEMLNEDSLQRAIIIDPLGTHIELTEGIEGS